MPIKSTSPRVGANQALHCKLLHDNMEKRFVILCLSALVWTLDGANAVSSL